MIKELQIPLLDLIVCLSDAMDLVSPEVVNHHKQVAYIAFSIGTKLNLPVEQRNNLMLAGALHDSGAFSLKERLDTLQFEVENPHQHAELGYLLLKTFKPLSMVANLVRFHHVPWSNGCGSEFRGESVPFGSHILHLADRIAVLINKQQEVLGQANGVCAKIAEQSGKMFMPELVDAFKCLSTKEYFWFDAVSPPINSIFARKAGIATIELGIAELLNLAKLFCRIIDFRSRFTAIHSTAVAATASALAKFTDFSERECQMMK
ncbi:MAG: HD domain-containing protein, partial [Nitrospirota bacterium]